MRVLATLHATLRAALARLTARRYSEREKADVRLRAKTRL